MIHAAVAVLSKVVGVDEVKILSDEMYRKEPQEDLTTQYGISIGALGVDISINNIKTFLPYEKCEDLIMYPTGSFVAVEFVHEILKNQSPDTFLKEE